MNSEHDHVLGITVTESSFNFYYYYYYIHTKSHHAHANTKTPPYFSNAKAKTESACVGPKSLAFSPVSVLLP